MHADLSACSHCGGPYGPVYERHATTLTGAAVLDAQVIDPASPPRGTEMPRESKPDVNGDRGGVGERS